MLPSQSTSPPEKQTGKPQTASETDGAKVVYTADDAVEESDSDSSRRHLLKKTKSERSTQTFRRFTRSSSFAASQSDFGSEFARMPQMDRSFRRNGRRTSRSLPSTPPSFKDRLKEKMRPKRPWEKYHKHGLACSSQPRLVSTQDARWRRRRARESTQMHSSSEEDADASPLFSTPLEEAAKPLVLAGVLMATEELDRLSEEARARERMSG